MCRVLRLALFGALLSLPLAAAQPSKSVSVSDFLASLNPAATAQNKQIVCPQSQPGCEGCISTYNDCNTVTTISFVRQKPNQVCVYACLDTETCKDTTCGRPDQVTYPNNFRVRSQPYEYPAGGCPAPDVTFCSTMEVGE